MKRIIAAVVLLFLTITLNFIGKIQVEKLCDKTTGMLEGMKEQIDMGDISSAIKRYNSIPEIENITPYIYNEEIVRVEDELAQLKSYLDESNTANAKISINKCIFLLKRIKEKESLSINSFL